MRSLCRITHLSASAWPAAILALAITAAGQSYNPPPAEWETGIGAQQSPVLTSNSSRSSSAYLVTVHELSHIVPRKAKAEGERAEKARREGRTAEAIRHFEQAIAIDPQFIFARNNLAIVHFMTDNPEAGIAQLQAAANIDPHDATVSSNLSLGYLMLQDLAAAERAARISVDLDRSSVHARLVLGLVLVQEQKHTEETVRCLELAKEDYPVVRLFLARVLVARGDLPQAKTHIEQYLSSGQRPYEDLAKRWLDTISRWTDKPGPVPNGRSNR